jgi:hypothetical protein
MKVTSKKLGGACEDVRPGPNTDSLRRFYSRVAFVLVETVTAISRAKVSQGAGPVSGPYMGFDHYGRGEAGHRAMIDRPSSRSWG